MKSFFKKIALVLTLAMVVGLIPANTASAATEPGLKYKSKIIYIDGDASGDYNDWCWTPSQNTKGYDVSYAVKSGSNLVTVSKNGKVEATGAGVGKAVIGVTYTKGSKSTTADFTVVVKRNATAVTLDTPSTKALTDEALKVGAELTLKVVKSKSTPVSWAKANIGFNNYTGVVTDLVRLTSSDANVLAVDGLKVTAKAAGTATLTVETYQKEGNVVTASKNYTVVVQEESLASVTQTAYNKFDATFGFEAKDLVKKEDIVVKDASGIIQPINTITWDTTGKIATVEMYLSLVDDTVYTVTYKDKAVEFKASVGEVAKVAIVGTKNGGNLVADNEATELAVKLYDVNGIDVTGNNKVDETTVTFTTTNTTAWINGMQLTMFNIGQVAPVKATYHTGKYNLTTGDEYTVVSDEYAFTCVDDVTPALTNNVEFTISDKKDGNADWTNKTTTIAVKDENKYLSVKVKDAKGNDVYLDNFESADTNKVLVNPTTGQLTPVAVGSVAIIAKSGNFKTVVTISVTNERTASTISASANSVSLSSAANLNDSAKVTLTVKDQYGAELAKDAVSATFISGKNDIVVADTSVNGEVTFRPAFGGAEGTASYKLTTHKDRNVVVTVTVRKPNEKYGSTRFNLSGTSIDTIVAAGKSINGITISAAAYDTNGVKMNPVTDVKYTITKPDNSKLYVSGTTSSPNVVEKDGTLVITGAVRAVSGEAVTKLAKGTYKVEGTTTRDGKNVNVVSTMFTVTDSSPVATVKADSVKTEMTIGADLSEILKSCFTVKFDGAEQDKATWRIPSDGYVMPGTIDKTGSYQVRVTKIIFSQDVKIEDGTTVTVDYPITLGTTITVTVK